MEKTVITVRAPLGKLLDFITSEGVSIIEFGGTPNADEFFAEHDAAFDALVEALESKAEEEALEHEQLLFAQAAAASNEQEG